MRGYSDVTLCCHKCRKHKEVQSFRQITICDFFCVLEAESVCDQCGRKIQGARIFEYKAGSAA